MLHPLLQRQLRRIGLALDQPPSVDDWKALLAQVSGTYAQAEEDRSTLERSLDDSAHAYLPEPSPRAAETQLATERDKLLKTVALLELTQDAVVDGILVIGAAGEVIGYNEKFVEIWRVPPEIMALRDGNRLLEHMRPMLPDTDKFDAVLRRLRAAPEERWNDEIMLVDGQVIERFSGPVPLPVGEGSGRIWMFRDVTDRRRAEDAICELNALLEDRIASRTTLLETANRELDENLRKLKETQAELVQTGKMAAIGTLVAGLSHELNNPINIIGGFAQSLLKRAALDDPARTALEAIGRQADRCAALVRALLDFSRRSSSAKPVPTAAGRLLAQAAELVGAQARRHGVDLRIAVARELPEIEVCPVEIETAILNLVGNALDATAPGGAIELRAEPVEADARPGVEITVIDAGAGIPPEILPRIFDPFFTTKPPGSGTGLGLSLTRQIVERHHGTIRVESQVGSGTTMRLWIPALRAPAALAETGMIT